MHFRKSKRKDSRASGESEDDEPVLLRAISFDQDGEGNLGADGDGLDGNHIFETDSGKILVLDNIATVVNLIISY